MKHLWDVTERALLNKDSLWFKDVDNGRKPMLDDDTAELLYSVELTNELMETFIDSNAADDSVIDRDLLKLTDRELLTYVMLDVDKLLKRLPDVNALRLPTREMFEKSLLNTLDDILSLMTLEGTSIGDPLARVLRDSKDLVKTDNEPKMGILDVTKALLIIELS